MTQENPNLTITLSGRRPVTIQKAQWPIIASAKAPSEPGDTAMDKLFVRQHRDGRTIVYGISGNGDRKGRLLDDNVDDGIIEAAVKAVGRELSFDDTLINECLAELPAEAI